MRDSHANTKTTNPLTLTALTLSTALYELIITVINVSSGRTVQAGLALLGLLASLLATYLVGVRRVSILTIGRLALPFSLVWTTMNIYLASQNPGAVGPRVYTTYLIPVIFSFAMLRLNVAAALSILAFVPLALVALTRSAPDYALLTDMAFLALLTGFLAVFGRQTNEERQRTRNYADLALRDSLTGIPNRRAGEERLAAWISADPRPPGAALILCDLDDFKKLNDTHGHGAGDEALRRVAEALQKHVRRSDLVCRWGGEEFLILMEGLTAYEATLVAERMRCELREIHLSVPHQLTLSGGVAMMEEA